MYQCLHCWKRKSIDVMKKFRLQLETDGAIFLNVLKHEKGNEYSLFWRIELKNSGPVLLQRFCDEKRFVVVDWTANVWVFDVEKKEKVFSKKFSGNITGKAVLSDDNTRLYVCYSKGGEHVAILNLEDYSIIRDLVYPDMGFVYHFEKYQDKLMLYSCTERSSEWSHHYSIIDIKTGEFSRQVLPFTQFDSSDRKRPRLDEKNGKLIMPYWGDIEYRKDDNDATIFIYKLMILDMKTFEVEKIISVREFPIKQIAYKERDSILYSERLIADEGGDRYREAMKRLLLNLNSLVLDDDGKSFWLCWRGGIVRRVDYDGNMSPLYATKGKPGSTISNAFEHNGFHSHLVEVRNDGVILQEHAKRNWMPIVKMNQMGAAIGDFIAIDLQELPIDAQIVIVKTEEDLEIEAERIYNVVNLENVDNHPSVLAALDYMIESEWKQVGHYLAFLFKDKDNKLISEKEFFKQIWEIEGALERMEKIAEKALNTGVHDRWGGDNDQTVLFNLFVRLCIADVKYHQLGLQFANEMDRDHDNWSCQDILGAVSDSMGSEAFQKELKNWEDLAEYVEYHDLE